MVNPRPYKLLPSIQNYAWGTKNELAYIPRLINITPEPDRPYAELWIGAHPKAPSMALIDDEKISLDKLISLYPEEALGEKVVGIYGSRLPYLLKILSINQALSIQAHPDKKTAVKLHSSDPEHYPDDNHKPEIAIALTGLEAIVGLKGIDEFRKTIDKYSEIQALIDNRNLETLVSSGDHNPDLVKSVYADIMRADENKLKIAITSLKATIEGKKEKTDAEKKFPEEYKNYGNDVGLISLLLFNYMKLKKNEAFYTPAGIPHAYLKGNIIECMANSDNVVRAGLTPKYKDIDTLTNILVYDPIVKTEVVPVKAGPYLVYKTTAEEFEVKIFESSEKTKIVERNNRQIKSGIVLEGEIKIICDRGAFLFTKGECFLIPAVLENFEINNDKNTKYVIVDIPGLNDRKR